MNSYPILLDLHTHSIASGHGTSHTITDMARRASEISLPILGVADHGPATAGSGRVSYFRSLVLAPRKRFGVSIFYGVELNIIDRHGNVDLPDDLLSSLDYAFIGMHRPVSVCGSRNENTAACIHAMDHPKVRFIAHADDGKFPMDYERLLLAAKQKHVYPELNDRSLMPDSYRKASPANSRKLLSLCMDMELPILLSSDSHGAAHIADMRRCIPLLEELSFPPRLVINSDIDLFRNLLA